MKTKTRYIVYIIIIVILSALIPGMLTNAKYLYNVNLESDVAIGNMIFNIEQKENEPEEYEIEENDEIIARYKLTNFNENNNINEINLKYYIKIVDNLDKEILPLEISIDGYTYIEYNVDEDGNIINADGDITDEFGTVIKEQNLKEEENEELQESLQHVKKGYGPISLPYDGETEGTKDIDIRIRCPQNYDGNNSLQYKIVVIAEGNDINAEESANLTISVLTEENEAQQQEQPSNTEESQNEPEYQEQVANGNETQNAGNEQTNQEDLENEINENIINSENTNNTI